MLTHCSIPSLIILYHKGQKGDCPREKGKPCRYPSKMRYSPESLGANVGQVGKA